MQRNLLIFATCSTLWALAVLIQSVNAAPNVVLIMADDMGYSDIGCYGGEISTPTLDRLAAKGLRFTQFYNTSRCCPTRAAPLTGLYSHQAGIGLMTGDRGFRAYRGDLNRRCVTLAEVLRSAGYRNYMSGKWHVTRHVAPDGEKHNWPLQRGFDRFYGTITGAGSFFDPTTLCRGNRYITPDNDEAYQPDSFYYTDAISENAIAYLRQHQQDHPDQPFFLYVAYTCAHWPMHALNAEIEKYQGTYDEGYDAIRQRRYQRARQLGVIEGHWPISPTVGNWDRVEHKDWELRCMEVYAAMVDRMDQGIGHIVEQLKRQDAFENTIVIYLQDNGGCAEGMGRSSNAHRREDFDFQPFGPNDLQPKIWPPMQTRDGRWVLTGPAAIPGPEDTYVAYGRDWANVSNTPFRGYKHDGYEGGIGTPLIVHWPAGIDDEQHGSLRHQPFHLIDIMPTLVEVSQATYPGDKRSAASTADAAESSIQPMEGVSLVPALHGQTVARDAALGFEHHGNLALRDGRWKLVSIYRRNQPTKWELYDMQVDRTEQQDVSDMYPKKKEALIAKWQSWADRVGVQPWPLPRK